MSYDSGDTTRPIDRLVAANAHASDALTGGRCRAVLVTVAGNLVCSLDGGTTELTLALEKGWHPLRLTHVRATSTATAFVGY